MASNYSSNLNMELITSGEQAGTWGDTTNQNWKRIEESRSYATQDLGGSTAVVNWTLPDTVDAYTTAALESSSSGRASFVKFTNGNSGGTTVNIRGNGTGDDPNRVFFARNASGELIQFDCGDGTHFALQDGATAIIYCTPTGNEVGNVFDTLQVGGNAGGTAGLILAGGSITDVTDAISFSDNSLTTTGTLGAGATTVASLNVSEGNITNVANIALDTISADDGSSFAFSNNWTAASRTCADLGIVTTADINGGTIDATNIGVGTAGTGRFTTLETTSTFALGGKLTAGSNEIEGSNFDITGGSISGITALTVDNININGNTISSTDTDGHIELTPNGTGIVRSNAGTLRIGDGTEDKYITTYSTGYLKLNTNGGTNASYITLFHSASDVNTNHIDINPNGSSNIRMFSGGGTGLLTLDGNSIDNVGYIHCNDIAGETGSVGLEVNFNGNTGTNIIRIQEGGGGRAEALLITDASDDDYMVFNTTAETITVKKATTFDETIAGSVSGNAATATTATNVTVTANNTESKILYPSFVDTGGSSGSAGLETDTGLTYNPNTGTLTVNIISGATTVSADTITGTNVGGTLSTVSQTNITGLGNVTAGSWDAPIHGTGELGTSNIAIGNDAGAALGGSNQYNTLVGDDAGKALAGEAQYNSFFGYQAGENCTGNQNTGIGALALEECLGGMHNTAIGRQSLSAVTTGSNNTGLGSLAGGTNQTGDQNTFIGSYSDTSATDSSGQIGIGYNVTGIDDSVVIGLGGVYIHTPYNGSPNWANVSDLNVKKNITQETVGLSLINGLNPVRFNYKNEEDFSDTENIYCEFAKGKPTDMQHGFIAQEVEQAVKNAGLERLDGLSTDKNGVYNLSQTAFIQPMVKAIQELSSKIDSLESRLAALE